MQEMQEQMNSMHDSGEFQDMESIFSEVYSSKSDVCGQAVDHEFVTTGGNSAELHGWEAKTAQIGASIRQIHLLHIHFHVGR